MRARRSGQEPHAATGLGNEAPGASRVRLQFAPNAEHQLVHDERLGDAVVRGIQRGDKIPGPVLPSQCESGRSRPSAA